MKPFFSLLLSGFCLYTQFCSAQECKSVRKTKTPTATEYVGAAAIHRDSSGTGNKFFRFLLGKYVTESDTSFILSLGALAEGVSNEPTTRITVLQFADGSVITKSNQPVSVILTIGGKAMLTVNVVLKLDEMVVLKNKSLGSITLAESKVSISETGSESIKEVAGCLPISW